MHIFTITLENRSRYGSLLHSIIAINVPIESISPLFPQYHIHCISLFLQACESWAINRLVCTREFLHFFPHSHIDTKAFHKIQWKTPLLLADFKAGRCSTTIKVRRPHQSLRGSISGRLGHLWDSTVEVWRPHQSLRLLSPSNLTICSC